MVNEILDRRRTQKYMALVKNFQQNYEVRVRKGVQVIRQKNVPGELGVVLVAFPVSM